MDEFAEERGTDPAPAVPEGVGDALRAAVERTLAATAGSAVETRQRAQGLLDEVVRRGQAARGEVAKRGEEAGVRLAEAMTELRTADREGLAELADRLARIERRLGAVEAHISAHVEPNPSVEIEEPPTHQHGQRDSEG